MELTYIKKPSTEKITVLKWTGENKQEVLDFCDEATLVKVASEIGEYLGYSIPTLTGNTIAKPGDFIIKLKKHNKEVFEVWSEQKLNEFYFNTADIDKAYLDIEKENISEKLNRLNAYITNPAKKAPYKLLNTVEQGFLLSEKNILESYLRTLLTYATYKYENQESDITFLSKSKVEPAINLDSGNKYIIKISESSGKCIAEFGLFLDESPVFIAKASRYDGTLKNLVMDLGDYFNFDEDWYNKFNISEELLEQEIQENATENIEVNLFYYKKEQDPIDPDPQSGD